MTADSSSNGGARELPDRPDAGGGQTVIWHTVRKNWATALVTALAVTLAVTFYTLSQTKIYQAAATIQFDPNPPKPLGAKVETVVDMGAGNYWDNHEYYETQYKIIQSMKVALEVVSQLGLNHDAGFIWNAPPNTKVGPVNVSPEVAALTLRGRVRVEPIKDSRLAVVKLEDADPERAQRVLTALVEIYVAMNLESAHASTSDAADWLRKQLDKLKAELEKSEMALHEYKENKNILSVALSDQNNMLREEMKQLNDALTLVRTKREEIQARRDQLAKVKSDTPTNLPATELLHSSLLQTLRHTYDDSVRERDGQVRGGKGKNHPDVQSAQAKVDAAREAILSEVRNVQGALDGDLAVVKSQENGLAGLFEGARRKAFDLNLLEIEYGRLHRAKEHNEKLYALVLERTKESDLARMLSVNNIRVIDAPLRPGGPIRPQVPLNIGTGIFVGVLLGIAAAMGRAVVDRTVKTPDDVEKDIGVTFIGLLPEIAEDKKDVVRYGRRRRGKLLPGGPTITKPELIVHDFPHSGIAEAARTVRTNLLFMAPDRPFKTILVTSAGPSEGKTTVACCIAVAMAQANQRVLVVDCDLRKPRIHRIFRIGKKGGGVTGVLCGPGLERRAELSEAEFKERLDAYVTAAILPTEVPNLSVIPAGEIPPAPAELLHSELFKAFLENLRGRFDRVIIDSPPVVPVTDAAILSTLADGTILVVRAFKTTKDLARHALRALVDVGTNLAGTVLNAVNLNKSEYKYSHYYYYRRSGYYADDEVPPSTRPSSAPEEQPPAA